ncbi:MAG: M3 family metallopeptidase [Planctomycetes bacterium]|nr:M3 family metallopeptidase [Planctomycetota bacterium]
MPTPWCGASPPTRSNATGPSRRPRRRRHVTADNPLLSRSLAEPPAFDAIRPEHVVPAIRQLVAEVSAGLEALERTVQPTWAGLVEPLVRLAEPLAQAWGAVNHLMGVRNSTALREAHEAVQPEVVRLFSRLGQSRPLYAAARALRESDAWHGLDAAQRRIVDASIRDAELAGVGLDGAARERFNAIQQELAELATRFSNNVLDSTKEFALTLTARDEVAGLPESARQLAAQSAREAGHAGATAQDGPWRISLDLPSFEPFMQHAERRDLRETLYRAYVSRASSGSHDNAPLIERILALRDERARILGFADHAAVSLSRKMAGSVEAVHGLLEELRARALPAAERDHAELVAFAAQNGSPDVLHWDVAYFVEKLRVERFAISDELLRPYFPLERVLSGLFALTETLFGVRVVPADGEAPVWHPDVRFFRIVDGDSGAPRAAFYLDPYSRPADKRGGAWMDECLGRSRLFTAPGGDVRLPIAHLVCNGSPPVAGERPSLLSFRDVETLFHEFGHGLQHMLTTVDRDGAAGITNVEWDAVELPSQFMENWCYHEPTLRGLSGHWHTGEPLPHEMFERIRAARTFRAGSAILRQLYFGFTDLALHHGHDPARDGSPFDVMRRVAERTTVLRPLPEDRFLCSFSHIFAGGYSAGYYSYKWAEVLSADAFAAFEEAGLDDEPAVRATGRRFRDTVLALGGSRHPMEVFESFRGRAPSTAALLRHAGLQ